MLVSADKDQEYASIIQKPVWNWADGTCPVGAFKLKCADLSYRLRDPPVSVRRLACFCAVFPCARRVYPPDHALARGAAAANLALPDGRII